MSSSRLLVLGASGQTGQCLVEQALNRGHHVTALVRDPIKIQVTHDNLEVAICNIFDPNDISPYVEKADVIMSTLGFSLFTRPVVGYFNITKILSERMREHGKRRLLLMHSMGTDPEVRERAPFVTRMFLKYVIGAVLDNMWEAEQYLKDQEHLDYTVVAPGRLVDKPVSDCEIAFSDDENYMGTGPVISRADVARYMLDCIGNEETYRKARAINPKE